MSDIVDRYLAVWNEQDPEVRLAYIQNLFTPDVTYTDPLADVSGHDGMEALVTGAQAQFPGFTFRAHGTADAHHHLVRFQWELGPEGAEAPVIGFDVVVLGPDGRISSVAGFLDRLPS